jgi:hypothetical protein
MRYSKIRGNCHKCRYQCLHTAHSFCWHAAARWSDVKSPQNLLMMTATIDISNNRNNDNDDNNNDRNPHPRQWKPSSAHHCGPRRWWGWVAKGQTMQSWSVVFRGDAAMLCNGCVVGGWAAVRRTMRLQTTMFRGVTAMRCDRQCFLGGGWPCNGQCACGPRLFGGTLRCIGWCCWGVGSQGADDAHAGSGIQGDTAVDWLLLPGGRQLCDGQDKGEAVGERRQCN